MKVEIGGFVTPNITISANSRIIFETGRKAEGEQSDSFRLRPAVTGLRRDW